MISSYKRDVVEFHTGIRSKEFYAAKIVRDEAARKEADLVAEQRALARAARRLQDRRRPVGLDFRPEVFEDRITELTEEGRSQIRRELSALQSRKAVLVEEASVARSALSDLEADYRYATKFLAAERPNFVYVRSNSWSGVDPAFAPTSERFRAAGIDTGAQVVFSFCPADRQFDEIVRTVPVDPDALPIAVALVTPVDDRGRVSAGNVRQAHCYPGAIAAKTAILEFAAKLRQHYEKTPILYDNVYNLNVLTDARFNDYMIGWRPMVKRALVIGRRYATTHPALGACFSSKAAIPGHCGNARVLDKRRASARPQ